MDYADKIARQIIDFLPEDHEATLLNLVAQGFRMGYESGYAAGLAEGQSQNGS